MKYYWNYLFIFHLHLFLSKGQRVKVKPGLLLQGVPGVPWYRLRSCLKGKQLWPLRDAVLVKGVQLVAVVFSGLLVEVPEVLHS